MAVSECQISILGANIPRLWLGSETPWSDNNGPIFCRRAFEACFPASAYFALHFAASDAIGYGKTSEMYCGQGSMSDEEEVAMIVNF